MKNAPLFAPIALRARTLLPSRWEVFAVLLVLGVIVFLADASRGIVQPLSVLGTIPISLSPARLPEYAARTSLRMLAALALSLLFTFTYATLAARNARAERMLVPLLDILQSVPILGFISVTAVFFMSLAPGRVLGAEFAAIFAIFTSQAWNMAFSFYQSLRTVPVELNEAARSFRLSPWMQFWRLDVPFAMPQLVWNMMMSMSGGWFFVVASEAITVGDKTVMLPGIGSYIAVAIQKRDFAAIGWAILAMLIVILIYDQLLFRPLVAWADRFRFDNEGSTEAPRSWVLTTLRRSRIIAAATAPFARIMAASYRVFANPNPGARVRDTAGPGRPAGDILWYGLLGLAVLAALWRVGVFVAAGVTAPEIVTVIGLGFWTMIRVFVLIALASAIWVPVGIWVGLRPSFTRAVQPVAQFLAAFPANLLFPIAVSGIAAFALDPDIWLSPLMILGTQWYILFNVIAGASAIPREWRDIGTNLQIGGFLWWRRIGLPAIFPYYVTGAVTASGGSWNAAIVAELVKWGDTELKARGLGAYIAEATAAGDFHRIVLGIAVMSGFVVLINRCFWRPLYYYAERKFRMG
jgi:NitT/TauT family transport system permease protein